MTQENIDTEVRPGTCNTQPVVPASNRRPARSPVQIDEKVKKDFDTWNQKLTEYVASRPNILDPQSKHLEETLFFLSRDMNTSISPQTPEGNKYLVGAKYIRILEVTQDLISKVSNVEDTNKVDPKVILLVSRAIRNFGILGYRADSIQEAIAEKSPIQKESKIALARIIGVDKVTDGMSPEDIQLYTFLKGLESGYKLVAKYEDIDPTGSNPSKQFAIARTELELSIRYVNLKFYHEGGDIERYQHYQALASKFAERGSDRIAKIKEQISIGEHYSAQSDYVRTLDPKSESFTKTFNQNYSLFEGLNVDKYAIEDPSAKARPNYVNLFYLGNLGQNLFNGIGSRLKSDSTLSSVERSELTKKMQILFTQVEKIFVKTDNNNGLVNLRAQMKGFAGE